MIQQVPSQVIYPDSDGQPMSDNTKQFRWIVVIKENLELLFADVENVFIGGNLLWYPVLDENTIRQAPDVMVAFGRPKGDRGSYKQWEEGNIAPQVAFEILSPSNTLKEMAKKQKFYQKYGVLEYYVYDPDRNNLKGWLNFQGSLEITLDMNHWISPHLGIRFELLAEDLAIYRPDGGRFLTYIELGEQIKQTEQRAEVAEQRAETAEQRAETAESRIRMLEARLRELGIDPEQGL